MKRSVSFYDFERAFSFMGRESQFTYAGKRALFDWLEEMEADTGEETELDVIALCCEFTEYDDLEDLQMQYSDIESMQDLQENTYVIEIPGGDSFIIADF